MADDEQFSLCWNNFNSNLSAGFHESLCRGDLVDVTLAAEGQLVKAHRLVLSVCSPYFRKMFTQMPANQHAFVFLKDVSHTALKDLIQFMYCGEVNVKQEALPAFISTAEALQIKGLTDSDPPQSQTPPEPSTPTPQIQQIQTSPRVRQRTSTARSYKIETVDDSGDETKQTTQIVIQTTAPPHPPQATITTQPQQQHQQQQQQQQQQQHHHQTQHITQQQQPIHTQTHQLTSISMPTATTTTVVTQKRPAQRTSISSASHIKRSKSTIDPLEAAEATVATHQINVQTTVVSDNKPQVQQHHQQQTHHHQQQAQQQQQQQQQQTNEPEYIDLPIELPTKSEPDYVEDAGEVDQAEQDANYVEDESYGDMRYDESYFTENEDAAAAGGNATAGSTQNTNTTVATTSKAIVKQQPQLSDSSYMDTSGDPANSDAQGKIEYIYSQRGQPLIVEQNYVYCKNRNKSWRCIRQRKQKCKAHILVEDDNTIKVYRQHSHPEDLERIIKGRKRTPHSKLAELGAIPEENAEGDTPKEGQAVYIYSQRGHPLIVEKNFIFCKNNNRSWRCIHHRRNNCKAHLFLEDDNYIKIYGEHTHPEDFERIEKARKRGPTQPKTQNIVCTPELNMNESKNTEIDEESAESDVY